MANDKTPKSAAQQVADNELDEDALQSVSGGRLIDKSTPVIFEVNGSRAADERPVEEVSLNYTKI